MLKTPHLLAAALTLAVAAPAQARNTELNLPIAAAMEMVKTSDKTKTQYRPEIKMYFSGQPTPKTADSKGTYTSNKKTNFFNKSDQEGCEWAFASAVLALQDRAVAEGGDAVIDIHSYYKKNEFKSATEYQCVAGAVTGGVTLRGTVVKLK
jgi:hypothetical protein